MGTRELLGVFRGHSKQPRLNGYITNTLYAQYLNTLKEVIHATVGRTQNTQRDW